MADAQETLTAWFGQNLTHDHFREWSDDDFARALLADLDKAGLTVVTHEPLDDLDRRAAERLAETFTLCCYDSPTGCPHPKSISVPAEAVRALIARARVND